MTTILSGKTVSKARKEILKAEIAQIKGRLPKLVVVIVGTDPASETYVASKAKQCLEVGMLSEVIRVSDDVTQEELLALVQSLNADETVDGLLVQFPLPKHLNEDEVMETIAPEKDVDGLNPLNVGYLETGKDGFAPCTAMGVISLLDFYDINLEGMSALVIGRSRLVGKPLASLLLKRNATVTVAHSRSKDIGKLIKQHELVVVAVGIPHFVKKEMVLDHHIIVDVGIHRTDTGLIGDVESIENAQYGSPVPGGVGPMTIVSLLENTLKAYKKKER